MNHRKISAARLPAVAAVLALALTACGDDGELAAGPGGEGSIGTEFDLSGASFDIGSKEFTESIVLGQIAAQALEAAGADVSDKTGISGSATVREALVSDEIDMYWEYTGTGWVNILGNTTEELPDDLYQAVAEADSEKNQVAWLEPAPMNDTYRIATTQEFAAENDLETTSDAAEFVAANPDQGAVCAASEFINRDDGLPGLQEAYDFEFSKVVELDLGLIYTQIGDTCPFGEVFSTDGRIVANDLVVLEDDEEFFIDYNAALTMREETLEEFPQLAELFAPISEALTNDVITQLNANVDVDGETAEAVAEEFLRSNGFIG